MQLFVRQAVRKVDWVEPGAVLVAGVQGGDLYQVTLEFSRDVIVTSCTCPYEVHCKHAAALILHLQTQSMESVITQTTTPKSPKSVKPSIAQPDADSFPGRAASRLGITLTAPQLKFLQQASIWWVGRQASVPHADLFRLCGQRSYWGYGQVQLWPAKQPPADETEFFACLALALQACQLALPGGLTPLADPEVQQRLLQKWERIKQIDQWRKRLGSWDEPQLHLAAEAPELRLVLHEAGALVQVRHPGEADFVKATHKLLKQFWGSTSPYNPARKIC